MMSRVGWPLASWISSMIRLSTRLAASSRLASSFMRLVQVDPELRLMVVMAAIMLKIAVTMVISSRVRAERGCMADPVQKELRWAMK